MVSRLWSRASTSLAAPTVFETTIPPEPRRLYDRHVSEMIETTPGWFAPAELEQVRAHLPIVYVQAVPVRVDEAGEVTSVGLLLRMSPDATITRSLVSGRVLHHERLRDALLRHLEKDLGPLALPRIPPAPQPFTVAEYFPTPGVTPFHDPRQHAVSLAYVVPVGGDCAPSQDALELTWFSPKQARQPTVLAEMANGQSTLLLQALAHVGV
jgi:ADP-ribose pyrophosphatase YjhB (NUDIX family)